MPISIVVPQLGESVAEGTVARWLKAQGDRVRKEEPLVEIQTDKINVEIPSPAEGTLSQILVAEGTTVLVGTEIAQLLAPGEAAGAAPAGTSAPAPAAIRVPAGGSPRAYRGPNAWTASFAPSEGSVCTENVEARSSRCSDNSDSAARGGSGDAA